MTNNLATGIKVTSLLIFVIVIGYVTLIPVDWLHHHSISLWFTTIDLLLCLVLFCVCKVDINYPQLILYSILCFIINGVGALDWLSFNESWVKVNKFIFYRILLGLFIRNDISLRDVKPNWIKIKLIIISSLILPCVSIFMIWYKTECSLLRCEKEGPMKQKKDCQSISECFSNNELQSKAMFLFWVSSVILISYLQDHVSQNTWSEFYLKMNKLNRVICVSLIALILATCMINPTNEKFVYGYFHQSAAVITFILMPLVMFIHSVVHTTGSRSNNLFVLFMLMQITNIQRHAVVMFKSMNAYNIVSDVKQADDSFTAEIKLVGDLMAMIFLYHNNLLLRPTSKPHDE